MILRRSEYEFFLEKLFVSRDIWSETDYDSINHREREKERER